MTPPAASLSEGRVPGCSDCRPRGVSRMTLIPSHFRNREVRDHSEFGEREEAGGWRDSANANDSRDRAGVATASGACDGCHDGVGLGADPLAEPDAPLAGRESRTGKSALAGHGRVARAWAASNGGWSDRGASRLCFPDLELARLLDSDLPCSARARARRAIANCDRAQRAAVRNVP